MQRKSAREHLHAAVLLAEKGLRLSKAGVWCQYVAIVAILTAVGATVWVPREHWMYFACLAWGALFMALGGYIMRQPALKWHVISRFHFYAATGDDPCASGCLMCGRYGVHALPDYVIEDRRWIVLYGDPTLDPEGSP
jgi:hypothetical protein